MASAISEMKIFPSPILPVRAAPANVRTTSSARASATTISNFTFGSRSTLYSCPRYTSLCPFWRPCPRTSLIVIPSIPIPLSASFTSSSLNGWMMASIFFMVFIVTFRGFRQRLRFEDVALFAVQADIEPLYLVFFAHPHSSEQGVANFQNDQGAHNGQPPGYGATERLIEHLRRAPVHQTERQEPAGAVFEAVVDEVGGEDAGQQRAQRATHTVHPEGIQGVVVAEFAFHHGNHAVADQPGGEANEQGGEGFYETGCRSDGNQARHAARDCAQNAGFSVVQPFGQDPSQSRGRRAEMRSHDSA